MAIQVPEPDREFSMKENRTDTRESKRKFFWKDFGGNMIKPKPVPNLQLNNLWRCRINAHMHLFVYLVRGPLQPTGPPFWWEWCHGSERPENAHKTTTRKSNPLRRPRYTLPQSPKRSKISIHAHKKNQSKKCPYVWHCFGNVVDPINDKKKPPPTPSQDQVRKKTPWKRQASNPYP